MNTHPALLGGKFPGNLKLGHKPCWDWAVAWNQSTEGRACSTADASRKVTHREREQSQPGETESWSSVSRGTMGEESRRGGDLLLSFLVTFQSTVRCLCSCCCFAPSFIKCTSTLSRMSLFCSSCVLCLVIQLCPTLCDPMDCNPPRSCVHGILQARVLEWVAVPFSRGIFPTKGLNPSLPHCRWILYHLSHQGSPRVLEWVAYPFSRRTSQPRNWTGVSCIAGRFFTS